MKLILRTLEVWNWQGLEHEVLGPFDDGLNLIDGPNESGKSRLRSAFDYALMLTHRGQGKRAHLRSKGSTGTPRVKLDFELDGVAYTVEKQFLDKPTSKLTCSGQTWLDEEALARLAELLGLGSTKIWSPEASQTGVWSLLWMRQGESGETPDAQASGEAATTVQDALARQTGAVVAGAVGQEVLERARKEYGRFRSANGQPRGELAAASTALSDAEAACKEAEAARTAPQGVASQLASVEATLEGIDDRIAERERAVAEAQVEADAAKEAEHQLRATRAEVETAKEKRKRLAHRLGQVEALHARTAELEAERRDLEAGRVSVAASQGKAIARLETAAALAEEAEDALQTADALVASAEAYERAVMARGTVEAQEQKVADAGRVTDALKNAEAGAAACLTRDTLDELDALGATLQHARAELSAATPPLAVTAHADLVLNGIALAAGEERSLREETIELEGLATVRIQGVALAAREDAVRDAERRLGQALLVAGVDSIDDARSSYARRQALESECAQHRARLEVLVPEGLAAAIRELERLESLAETLPADPGVTVAVARAQRKEANSRLRELRAGRDAARQPVTEAASGLSGLAARVELARTQAERVAQELEALPAQEEFQGELGEAQAELDGREALAAAAQQRFDAAGGAAAPKALVRALRAVEGLRKTQEDARERRASLRGNLETIAGQDLHARVQEAKAEAERARDRLDSVKASDRRATRLVEVLEHHHAQARDRLMAPIIERVAPWLPRIFPQSELRLEGAKQTPTLVTGAITEHFAELSGGAREQLGIMVRTAIGQVIAGEGRVPVVLDDALVNTDHERLGEMLSVLDEASADGVQVLVFTCHDVDYDGLGAHYRHSLDKPALRLA